VNSPFRFSNLVLIIGWILFIDAIILGFIGATSIFNVVWIIALCVGVLGFAVETHQNAWEAMQLWFG
jgi:hypothetical protein